MLMEEWYLEYRIVNNRPGLLGDIAALLGMLDINISTVNSLVENRRGFLLEGVEGQVAALARALEAVPDVSVTALRPPFLADVVALKHGQTIPETDENPRVYAFVREQCGLLIDFMGELIRGSPAITIGLRGMPRVGKTESAIAACVHANKRWIMVSGTILRLYLRGTLSPDEEREDCVYLLDAIATTTRGDARHRNLVQTLLEKPVPKIIEHPDIFVREGILAAERLSVLVELRRSYDERIDYANIASSTNSFDIS